MNKKVILVILDGWGIAKPDKFNAIDNAKTPNMDMLTKNYPNMLLKADGENVGLPKGQMGTSEVNHLAIGTGRIVWQDLPKINKAIEDGKFFENEELLKMINHVKQNGSKLHLAGILSDGGIHSHIDHLITTLKMIKQNGIDKNVYIHVFTDGRDCPPISAERYLVQLDQAIKDIGVGEIATLQGRVFLDRDRDWAKTEKAFKLIRSIEGKQIGSWKEALEESYKKYDNDQYHEQYWFTDKGKLEDNDGILYFHYRTDRIYQMIKRTFDEKLNNLYLTAFCQPSSEFNFTAAFNRAPIENCLAKVISDGGKKQMHITETEKYPHLTFFFNGEREQEMPGEKWNMFESNRFVKPTYNFEPSMQAFNTTKTIIENIEKEESDFIVVNYANTDMVGHTGNYEAALIAAEAVDYCVGKVYEAIKDKLDKYAMLVTADHGNSDEMWNYEENQPHTQHTLNPVPFIVVSDIKDLKLKDERDEDRSLQNIAPTVLELMGLEKTSDMEGYSLLNN